MKAFIPKTLRLTQRTICIIVNTTVTTYALNSVTATNPKWKENQYRKLQDFKVWLNPCNEDFDRVTFWFWFFT